MQVALVTENRFLCRQSALDAGVEDRYFANIEREDALITMALGEHQIETQRVSWEDRNASWASFSAAIIRTTWNYFIRFRAFGEWLTSTEKRVRILNPPELLRWNWDKRYLQTLGRSGVNVLPSRFVEAAEAVDFAEELARRPGNELVIKPAISGGARHTYLMTRENQAAVEKALVEPRQQEVFLIQDVQRSILTRGEVSLLYFGGTLSHAVRKIAKPGDFRVQDDHGGTFVDHTPTTAESAEAAKALSALPTPALYARVDIADDNHGRPAVIEVELIEPELFLRSSKTAATAFASALAAALR